MATASSARRKLTGRRVILRAFEESDADALFEAVAASKDLLKRRLSWAAAVKSASDELDFIRKGPEAGRVWGIFDGKSQALLGAVSLEPVGDPAAAQERLSMWVRADRNDRGFGTEAGKLVVEQAFRKSGVYRLSVRLEPVNRSFRRLLKKIGFRYEGCLRGERRLNGRWIDQECWGMLRGEWKK